MNQKPANIIALFTRGREVGFVILEGGILFRYGVKTIKGHKRGKAFFSRLTKLLRPTLKLIASPLVIVIEETENRSQGALGQTLPRVLSRVLADGDTVMEIPLAEAKQLLCEDADTTHRTLIDAVVDRHPTLWSLVNGAKRQKPNYWQKVLMALALAEAAIKRLEARKIGR